MIMHNAAFRAALSFAATVVLCTPLSAQWTRGEGVPGYDTAGYAFAVHARGDVALCGTQRAGVFVSTDAGVTWTPHVDGLPVVDERLPDVLDVCVTSTTWWCGTAGRGLWRCLPGQPWTQDTSVPGRANILAIDVADDGTVDVGMQMHGVYRRGPADTSFRQVLAPPLDSTSISVLEIERTRRGMYAGTRYDGYLLQSSPDAPWRPENPGLPMMPMTGGRLVENAQGWMVCNALAFKLDGGIYRRGPTDDAWELFSEGIDGAIVYAFGLDTYRSTFVMSTGYFGGLGVYLWTPGEPAWTPWNDGLPDLRIEGVVCVPRGGDTVRVIAGSRYHGVYWRDTVITVSSVTDDAMTAAREMPLAVSAHQIERIVDADALIHDHMGRMMDRRCLMPGLYVVVTPERRWMMLVY